MLDPLHRIGQICDEQPHDALSQIADILGFGEDDAGFQPIETAPKNGAVIGGWCAGRPGVIQLVRWGYHLGNAKHQPTWITITRGIAVSNLPTHWIHVPPSLPTRKSGSD